MAYRSTVSYLSLCRLRTPDKLPAAERDAVVRVCDKALARIIKTIKPKLVIGIGKSKETHTADLDAKCGKDIHFSKAVSVYQVFATGYSISLIEPRPICPVLFRQNLMWSRLQAALLK